MAERFSQIRLVQAGRIVFWCQLLLLFIISGCQAEFSEIEEPDISSTLQPNDEIVTKVLKMLLLDGSGDNVLDKSSCTKINLPISILVNNEPLTIESDQDLIRIDEIFNESKLDQDTIVFVFPLTLVYPDYTEQIVNDFSAFRSFTSVCENGSDQDIECIDFEYPILLSTYDRQNELALVKSFVTDKSLFSYLKNLDSQEITEFIYPISLIDADDQVLVVQDNSTLANEIANAEGLCDEADEVEENEVDELKQLIESGSWEVSYFHDGSDLSSAFDSYIFSFGMDNFSSANKNNEITEGYWEIDFDDFYNWHELELEYESGDPPLVWLNDDWRITSRSPNQMNLVAESEIDQTIKSLTITKLP